jgi:hypothetical protein
LLEIDFVFEPLDQPMVVLRLWLVIFLGDGLEGARVAIKDGRLLRMLGFTPRTRSGEVVIDGTLESPALPAVSEQAPPQLKAVNS